MSGVEQGFLGAEAASEDVPGVSCRLEKERTSSGVSEEAMDGAWQNRGEEDGAIYTANGGLTCRAG